MKKKSALGLVMGSAMALTLTAAPAEAGRIGNRQDRQQTRIARGIQTGSLTAREAARLERREAHLNRSVARMRKDGLNARERVRIEKRQDRISRGIYHQKHDRQAQ